METDSPEVVGVPVEHVVQEELPEAPRQAQEAHPEVALPVVEVGDGKGLEGPEAAE